MNEIQTLDVLVTDWDETITEHDTMHLISEAAYCCKPTFTPPWSYFFEEYMKDYENYSKNFGPRQSLHDEREFLTGLDKVEAQSVRRVENSGLFEGIPELKIAQKASKTVLKDGWLEVYNKCVEKNLPVIIVSVNWSSTLIREALAFNGIDTAPITIYANDIEMDGNGYGTGKLVGTVKTASDKQRIVEGIRQKYPEKVIAYAGDSGTDLLAILAADLGFIMGKEQLKTKLENYGIADNKIRYLANWHDLPIS